MFQYQAFTEPNPLGYPVEDAPYGATRAFPNLFPDQLADELRLAQEWDTQPIELGDDLSPDATRQAISVRGERNWIYVVLVDGRMFVIPYWGRGQTTTHTMASRGLDVIAAGQINFDDAGNPLEWDGMSGHYRPDQGQSNEVVQAILALSGFRSS